MRRGTPARLVSGVIGAAALVAAAGSGSFTGAAPTVAAPAAASTTATTHQASRARPRPVAERPIASRPTSAAAWIARIVVPVHPRNAPRASAKRRALLTGQGPYNKNPEVLLVVGATSTVRDGVWYRVQLNSRPNGSAAWVPAAAVRVTRTPMRVLVSLSERTMTVYRADRQVARWRVAVGTTGNPTPQGSFALSEIVPQRPSNGFFGTHIITLNAHSEQLNDFDGGDGRVAIHGTNRPQLIGQAVSHGCLRMANGDIRRLARMVPAGAPIDIVE